jgi:antitoxin HicB
MLTYPATLTPDGDGYLVRFPDLPEALTQGSTREEALDMAADALRTAMDFYFEDGRRVPMPSRVKRGQIGIELPPSVVAKVLLLNAMLEQRVTAAELARRLHTSPQSVNRIVKLGHPTKIDTVASAMKALGHRMELVVR